MAIRLRKVDRQWVALCAVETDPKEGDIYLSDGLHYALACKFAREHTVDWSDARHDALAATQKVRDAEATLKGETMDRKGIRNGVTADEVADLLNELVELDRSAMKLLVESRVPCNKGLGDHPTAQVSTKGDGHTIGFLGVLNGLFGIADDGCGTFAAGFEVVCQVHDRQKGKVGDSCPTCRNPPDPFARSPVYELELGDLIGFEVIRRPDDPERKGWDGIRTQVKVEFGHE